MNKEEIELLEDLFLVAMLNKEQDETIKDVSSMLVNTNSLSFDEVKEIVANLKSKGAIIDENLSFLGITLANIAKEKFQIRK